jgi:hypothetical protein
MQVALGRLQVSIFVLPPDEAREEGYTVRGTAARETPLERAYRREQALQRVETDRAHWAHRASRM